jgi:hypothetical protein
MTLVEVIGESLDKQGFANALLPNQGKVCALALTDQLGVVMQHRQDLAAIGKKSAFVFSEQHSQCLTFRPGSGLQWLLSTFPTVRLGIYANWHNCANYSIILEITPIGIKGVYR